MANHRKNHISLVFQNYNLIDYLTPVENVKLGGNADAEILLTQMEFDKSTRKRKCNAAFRWSAVTCGNRKSVGK